jgi:hypothetical protein
MGGTQRYVEMQSFKERLYYKPSSRGRVKEGFGLGLPTAGLEDGLEGLLAFGFGHEAGAAVVFDEGGE